MKVDVIASDAFTVVKPDGDIRIKTILPLKKTFERLRNERKVKVALDLTRVRFIDSGGIGMLLNFAKMQKESEGLVCLYNYRDDVKELLDIVDFGDFIPIFKDYDEMKRALSG